MRDSAARPRSRVPWALALTVGLCSGLAGYVIHVAQVRRLPKQVVTVKRLTDMPGSEESPAISPDGKLVAFVAASSGKRQIWVQKVSGGTPTLITGDDAGHPGPRWFPDSQSLIYFASGATWQTSASGGLARQMRAGGAGAGDLSHDGRHLAFFRMGDGNGRAELETCQVDICTTVTTLGAGSAYSNVRWSPDDKKIAFLHDMQVMAVDASGGEPARATDVPVQGFAWTPDNKGLIVSTRGELWFIPRVERGSPSQLTFGELSYESPDISATGDVVVSRRGLYTEGEADIVMFTGLKW